MVAFNISDRDIDALARLAYAEAQNIASKTGDLKGAYGSVVDAVLNRAAANQGYLGGNTIEGVINHTNHPRFYQFTPIAGTRSKSWEGLKKPPQEVYEAVRGHLRDLQKGNPNLIGTNTHYLNPHAPGTQKARQGWASGWASWPSVGAGSIVHHFGNPDRLSVPEYTVSYEPGDDTAVDALPADATIAEQYAHYGRSREAAPAMPVDRDFQTPDVVYGNLAKTFAEAGVKGLGDARSTFAAPAGVVERMPAPPVSLPAVPAGEIERSVLAPPGAPLPDTAPVPSTLNPEEDYFGPEVAIPRSRNPSPASGAAAARGLQGFEREAPREKPGTDQPRPVAPPPATVPPPASAPFTPPIDRGTKTRSVPSLPAGMEAISALFDAPAGSKALSRGDSRISFESLGDGRNIAMTNQFGVTRNVAREDYGHPSRSAPQQSDRDSGFLADLFGGRENAGGGDRDFSGSILGALIGGLLGGPIGAAAGGRIGSNRDGKDHGNDRGIGGFFSSIFGGGFPDAPADPSQASVSKDAATAISRGKSGLY